MESIDTPEAAAAPAALFRLSEDGARLRLVLSADVPAPPRSLSELKSALQAEGYGGWFVLEEQVKKALPVRKIPSQETFIDVAERRDGKVSVTVADDVMEASITITRAYGGEPVSRDDVKVALRERNVVFGVLNDVIERELRNPSGEPMVVARGLAPVAGKDAELTSRVAQVGAKKPKIRSDGTVEFRELGQFVNVKPGDVLMERIPPTSGAPGTDIHGQVIPAKPGLNIEFAANLEGAAIDPRNPNRLLATAAGMPKVVENGIWVDSNLSIKDVDLSTGNVYFEGDVQITGDVTSGMRVVATGSIHIAGTVEAAQLQAGGDIIIANGVIGHGEVLNDAGQLSDTAACLKADGSIQARFFNNAYLDARDVLAAEMIAHSVVVAKGHVLVGVENAKKGHIIGGRAKAKEFIQAHVLGSLGNVRTYLEVGADPVLVDRYQDLTTQIEKRVEELEKLGLLASGLQQDARPDRPDLPSKIQRAQTRLQTELGELQKELSSLRKKVEEGAAARIIVTKKAFGGVQIAVNGARQSIPDEIGPGTFAIRNNVLTYEK